MYSNRGNIKTFVSLIIAFLIFHNEGLGQVTVELDATKSGGRRTILPNSTGVLKCPNTHEYVPLDYSPTNGKTYPLIISLLSQNQMVNGLDPQTPETNEAAIIRVSVPALNSGIPGIIEDGSFPPTTTFEGTTFEFIHISIQCVKQFGYEFSVELDNVLSNYILTKYPNIDINRIYLTGISRGAGMIWEFIEVPARANKIAAIIPMSSGTFLVDLPARIQSVVDNVIANPQMGVYLTHNTLDDTTPIGIATTLQNAINAASPNRARLNNFGKYEPEIVHDSWTRSLEPARTEFKAYNNALGQLRNYNVYQWMLGHSLVGAALPVTLTSFDAQAVSKEVVLKWSTASESNSSHFSVERSSNGKDFKDIGRVNSHGNSSTPKNYSFTDNAPLSGNSYYRLKMIDRDATFKYSDVRKVSLNGSDLEFSFGPNPVSNEAWIKISGTQKAAMQITITDLMGRTLKTMNVSKTGNDFSQRIDMGGLKAGQYILSIRGENINYTQRLIKR